MRFFLPEAALDQHIAVLGKTGSGKTFTAKGVVEHVLKQKRQVCVIDPTGAWYGLRLGADGKGRGFDVVLLGGEYADVPLSERSGPAVARLVTEQGASVVIDTSGMTTGSYTRWFIDFAETLYTTLKNPLHLVIDEAHYFAPQQGGFKDIDANKMLHTCNRLMSGGRSRGVRAMLITQRPSKLHKDSLTCADTLIAMRMIAPQDRGAVKEWIDGAGDVIQGKKVLDSLAQLQRGEGWVWYPEGGHLERVQFPAISTYDSSAAPKHGTAAAKVVSKIDLTEVNRALADAVKEAEANDPNDPKLLRKKIVDLESQLKNRPAAEVEKIVRVEVPVLKNGQLDRTEKIAGRVEAIAGKLGTELTELRRLIAPAQRQTVVTPKANPVAVPRPVAAKLQPVAKSQPREDGDSDSLTGPEHRILDALAELEALGVAQPDKVQVALLAGYTNLLSKGFANGCGRLRATGLIVYPNSDRIALTDAGRESATAPERPRTAAEVQERFMSLLGGVYARVLRPIIDAYPNDVSKEELMGAAGYSNALSKGFANTLGRLRTLGLIDYPTKGRVVAMPVLFLE